MRAKQRRARALASLSRRLCRLLNEAKTHADHQTVHDLRVAARRLRAYARMREAQRLSRELRWLVHATNQLRDLDVACERDGALATLRQAREAEQGAVQRVLNGRRAERLKDRVATVKPFTRKQAERRIARLRQKIATMPSSEAIAAVHALRRALRELQYCLDWIGESSAQEKRLQHGLGAKLDSIVVHRVRQQTLRTRQRKPD